MGTYTIQIGDFTCMVVQEFATMRPKDVLYQNYPNASEAEIEAALTALGITTEIGAYQNALYIDNGTKKILVDTGMGSNYEGFGNIIPHLKEAGVQPEDIDIVFITHFHGDHINGLVDANGNPNFPNAHYVTSQSEWNYWMNPDAIAEFGDQRGYPAIIQPLEDKFSFVSHGDTLATGMTIVEMPGHTMGHTGLMIESNGEKLFHVVDLLHHAVQFAHPDWHHRFDTDKPLAVSSRRAMLQLAADEDLLTAFYHLAFPALGHISVDGDGYKFTPIRL